MKRHFIIYGILAIFLITAMNIYAEPQGRRWQMDDVDFPEFTKEQKDQMADLRSQHQKEMIPLRSELKLKRVELKDMLRDEASQSRINGKLDEIGDLRTEISKLRMDHRLKMRDILTDEQKEFFDSHPGLRKHFKGKMKDRFHHKGPRGGRGFHGFGGDFDEFGPDDDDFEAMGPGNCPGPGMCQGPCARL